MKEFLKKIKLIEYLTTEIEIQKSEFVSKLSQHVDEGNIGVFSSPFEAFSSSKNEYKGQVRYDGFKIKRRRRVFDSNMSLAVAIGTYRQSNEKLIIETEINGFNVMMIPFYLFALVFYSIFIGIFSNIAIEGNGAGFVLPFIFIHAAFMFGIPYFLMRRSANRMKHELEREFYYIAKK